MARILLAMLCLLALTTSASAECAWVLRQRVDSFDSRARSSHRNPRDIEFALKSESHRAEVWCKFNPLAAPPRHSQTTRPRGRPSALASRGTRAVASWSRRRSR
jgi:hypothetical protein